MKFVIVYNARCRVLISFDVYHWFRTAVHMLAVESHMRITALSTLRLVTVFSVSTISFHVLKMSKHFVYGINTRFIYSILPNISAGVSFHPQWTVIVHFRHDAWPSITFVCGSDPWSHVSLCVDFTPVILNVNGGLNDEMNHWSVFWIPAWPVAELIHY